MVAYLSQNAINQGNLQNITPANTVTLANDNNPSSVLQFYTIDQAGGFLSQYYIVNKTLCPFINSDRSEEKLQSASRVILHDLICEGPIYGLFDDLGNDLVLFDNAQNNEDNLKGVYLNDFPIKNSINNSLNYNRVSVYGKVGYEFQSSLSNNNANNSNGIFSLNSIGTVYDYSKPLYNLSTNSNLKFLVQGAQDQFANLNHAHTTYVCKQNGKVFTQLLNYQLNTSIFKSEVFEECFGVYHEIKDENTDFLLITFKVNSLFRQDKGSTYYHEAHLGIQLGFKQNPDFNYFIYHKVKGIATSPYQFDIVLNVKDFNKTFIPFIKIYNFSNAPALTDLNTSINLAVSSVTEIINENFKYPSSAYYIIDLDARGFSNLPTRSYNLKLLQIKVPENYDADSKTYTGFWSGEFDSILRWTDNPAWVLYDLITNYKYGIGKFDLSENLVDKWSMYQIAKYCDELVPTFNNTKYPMLSVAGLNTYKKSNFITLRTKFVTPDFFQIGGLLCLTNLKFNSISASGESEVVFKSFRKRIKSFVISQPDISGNIDVIIELFNDFGLHKVCSQFGEVKDFLLARKDTIKTSNQALSAIINEVTNTNSQLIPNFKNFILSQKIFEDDELNNYISLSGSAAQKFDGFLDIVEPRFTCNLFINSETDVINLVNNFASIFRGLVYWSNDYLKFDNDRPKDSVYFFNNSNVKDGMFTYSGSSKDTRYTVAKITYSDLNENFKDRTIYVEDKLNIRKYGYVEKELLGFGISSKSQAKRIGEWFLLTNQIEQDIVSFQAGPEAILLNPGDIIDISDSLKLSNRFGGRVIEVNNLNEIVLDNRYDLIKVGDSISFIVPKSSVSTKNLNELVKDSNNNVITDAQIENLSTTYVYTFVVSSVGLDGNFRTKIQLTTSSAESQEYFYTIAPSSLWIYDKSSTNTSSNFSQQYRILGIKESNPVEYDITAVEYNKYKFTYIDNRDNLSNNTIYSSNSNNQTVTIPRDIIPELLRQENSTVGKIVYGDGKICSQTKNYTYDSKYDYIMNGIDFSDSQISTLFSVNTINVNKILDAITTYSSVLDITPSDVKGLLIEYVLNSKKVSFKWNSGDKKNIFTIAVPLSESDNTNEIIRVYPLGLNDSLI